MTGANLILDYVLSNAAVSRSFTAYLGTAFGFSTAAKWRVTISALPKGFNEIDFFAVITVLIITVIICYRSNTPTTYHSTLFSLNLFWAFFPLLSLLIFFPVC